jgi:hypothetical protein
MPISTTLTDWNNTSSWLLLLLAILVVDVVVMIISRHTRRFGDVLNVWYDRFGIGAVISDVFIIAIGFAIGRWVYNTWFRDAGLAWFLGILVIVQMIHDILFYLGVILPMPRGLNAMMDVFKDYSNENSWKIIVGDAGLMLASAGVFMGLERLSAPWQIAVGLLTLYALPYALTTRSVKS